jgi:hypothetical protein
MERGFYVFTEQASEAVRYEHYGCICLIFVNGSLVIAEYPAWNLVFDIPSRIPPVFALDTLEGLAPAR